MSEILGVAVIILLVVLVTAFVFSRIRIAPQTDALLLQGSRNAEGSKVVKPGGRAFVIPVLQSATMVPLGQMKVPLSVGGVDKNKIPLEVSGVAMVKVRQDDVSIRDAQERFGSAPDFQQEVTENLQQVLIGSLRSAVSSMSVEELLTNRETLAAKVREATESEVKVMGIAVDSLQVLDIQDRNGYIQALGAREAEKVKSDARIAQAEYNQSATDKEVASQQAIAERERDLELRRASLREETDRARAIADAAGPLAQAEQDKKIATLKQETAEQQAILRERELETEVKKPADAEKYRIRINAEAASEKAVIEAEADARARTALAEAEAQAVRYAAAAEAEKVKLQSEADADRVQRIGAAEASAIAATGAAEADAMRAKADSYKEYGEAAILELLMEKAPEIARELAAPMGNIDKLTVISTDGAGALPKTVANNVGQLDEIFANLTGESVTGLIKNFAEKSNALNSDAAIAPAAATVETDAPTLGLENV